MWQPTQAHLIRKRPLQPAHARLPDTRAHLSAVLLQHAVGQSRLSALEAKVGGLKCFGLHHVAQREEGASAKGGLAGKALVLAQQMLLLQGEEGVRVGGCLGIREE